MPAPNGTASACSSRSFCGDQPGAAGDERDQDPGDEVVDVAAADA